MFLELYDQSVYSEHAIFPLHINIQNFCILVTYIDKEFDKNVNVNAQMSPDWNGGCHPEKLH
jgi:hypothetical protein